jgi:uncharacterized membrane protein YkvA (DUF1232 family)
MHQNQKSDDTKNQDFYRKLRKKILTWANSQEGMSHQWADILLLAPDIFYLLIRLTADPDVPVSEKAKLAIATAYFVSPLDLLPEIFLGPVGFLDDIVFASYALNSILNQIDPEIVKKHWLGKDDALVTIQRIVSQADQIVGSGLVKKIRKLVK